MKLLLPCLLLLAACDAQTFNICPNEVFGEIYSQIPVNCDEFNTMALLTEKLMEDSGMWPHFRQEVRNIVRIEVDDVGSFDRHGDYYTIGKTVLFQGVYLNRTGEALTHEMFHVRDIWLNGGGLPSNYAHERWQENGRQALQDLTAWNYFDHDKIFLMPQGTGGGWCNPAVFETKQRYNLFKNGWGPSIDGYSEYIDLHNDQCGIE